MKIRHVANTIYHSNGPDGIDVLIDVIQPQNHYPQTSDKIIPVAKPSKKEYEWESSTPFSSVVVSRYLGHLTRSAERDPRTVSREMQLPF